MSIIRKLLHWLRLKRRPDERPLPHERTHEHIHEHPPTTMDIQWHLPPDAFLRREKKRPRGSRGQ